MRLLSLHIDAFGKLSDFKLDFDAGLTEIMQENGYGKSTVAAFIKAMLYGLPDNRKRGIANERKFYAPWSGGDFGGTLDIETEKGRFRIERRFSPSGKDSFELLSLETGLDVDDYGENTGFDIFGLDAESYEKSTYLPQRRVETEITDSIGARLTGLLEQSDDMLNFESAVENIMKRRKEYKILKGHGGLLDDARDELALCETKIESCEGFLREAEELRLRAAELEAQAQAEQNAAETLIEKQKEENELKLARKDYENYTELLREAENAEREYSDAKAFFSKGIPEKDETDYAQKLISSIEYQKSKLNSDNSQKFERFEELKRKFGEKPPTAYDINIAAVKTDKLADRKAELTKKRAALPKKPETQRVEKAKRTNIGVGIVFAALGCAALILGIINILPFGAIIGAILLAMGVGISAISAFESKKTQKAAAQADAEYRSALSEWERMSQEIAEIEGAVSSLESELSLLFAEYGMSAKNSSYEAVIRELSELSSEYQKLSEARNTDAREKEALLSEIAARETELAEFYKKYGIPDCLSPQSVQLKSEGLTRLGAELEAKKQKAAEFKAQKGIENEPKAPEFDPVVLEEAAKRAQSEARRLSEERARLAERAQKLEKDAEALPELKDRKEELRARIEEFSNRVEIYDKTVEYLQKAKENLSSRYIVNMKNSFESRFSELTGNTFDIGIDANLAVKIRAEGGARKSESFSAGWQTAITLCLRLSLIDALYENERPFIVLDDPFVNLDDAKLARALEMLRRLANDTQIIYLTCHTSRSIDT